MDYLFVDSRSGAPGVELFVEIDITTPSSLLERAVFSLQKRQWESRSVLRATQNLTTYARCTKWGRHSSTELYGHGFGCPAYS